MNRPDDAVKATFWPCAPVWAWEEPGGGVGLEPRWGLLGRALFWVCHRIQDERNLMGTQHGYIITTHHRKK